MDNSFENLCRLCLQLIDESSVDLFEQKNGHLVADLIKVICPIKIENNQRHFPERICGECLELVIDAIHLRDVSLMNDKELRRRADELELKVEMIIEVESDDEVYFEERLDSIDVETIESILPEDQIYEVNAKPEKLQTKSNYCELCDSFFYNPSSFKRHQLRKHKKVCYTCDLCNSSFKTKHDTEQHMKTRHRKKPAVRYLYTEKLTLDLSELYERLDEPEAITCTFCSYSDHDEKSLNRHLRTHQAIVGSGKMYCNQCPTAIKSMEFLVEHTRSHNEPRKTHRCLICSKTFPFDEKFQNHLKNHKKNQHKVCFCPLCGRKFSKNRMLEDHIRFIHKKEALFTCPDCGKGFGSKSALNGHLKRHIEGNKYLCPFCPKSFSSHNLLNSHKAVHLKDRPFACNLCDKTFKHQKVLNDHLKRHDVLRRQYFCSICNRSLVTSYALARHIKSHTGDKPFKCEFCTKSYAQKNDLNRHVRSHVGENTYFCDFPECDETFRILAELKLHQGSHYVGLE